MTTASLPVTQSGTRASYGPLLFHLCMIGLVIADQVIVAPSRVLIADNTWHFQFARDIVAGVPVYWSAVDANRLFPDLLFGVIACLLPNGTAFTTWTVYFYVIGAVATYLSLALLANALFADDRGRRLATVLTVVGLMVFLRLVPFWDVWLMEPGNHGMGVPVCIVALVVLLHIRNAERVSAGPVLLFIVLAAVVAASNRYLIVAFLAPLVGAALVAYGCQLLSRKADPARAGEPADPWRRHRYLLLAAIPAAATIYGYFGWGWLGAMSWHKVVQLGGMVDLPQSDYTAWGGQRFEKLFTEMEASNQTPGDDWGAPVGVVLLAFSCVVSIGLLLMRVIGRRALPAFEENRFFFGLFTGGSALASLAFVTFLTQGSGSWQFRFLAVSVAFSLVFFGTLLGQPAERVLLFGRAPWFVAGGAAVLLLGLSSAVSSARKEPVAQEEAYIARGIAELEGRLRAHSAAMPMRGLSEYWIANDVTTRSRVLRIESMEPEKGEFRFYNDNAEHLCHNDFFFILQDARKDEPRMAALIATLGEPKSTETIDLARYPKVTILFYDPAVIAERIVTPAREAAPKLFPTFACPRPSPETEKPR